jgi:hypothetical protein
MPLERALNYYLMSENSSMLSTNLVSPDPSKLQEYIASKLF